MSLYTEWKKVVVFFVQTKGEDEFWKELNSVQQKIIPVVLKNHTEIMEGSVKDLAKKFDVSTISFVGFLDGINSSLKEAIDLESLTEDTNVKLDINFEKLYIDMLQGNIDDFFNLPEWNIIFPKNKLTDLKLTYGVSKTIENPNKVKRNDPCPCGSGKKYKHCCGR
ncbi:SEC-C metal-binding domain-containing protein [Clostridium cochlearium]|uniref:SEC-C metal-binding domain-containing protein n=1 Tax=Clostridium cochlearium TaxID=1494 RepID=UPI003F65F856